MVVLISPPTNLPNELSLVNNLLGAMPELVFHLRKPGKDLRFMETYLGEIKEDYHARVVMHFDKIPTHATKIKGLHCSESLRKSTFSTSKFVSTSFHSIDTVKNEGEAFDYFFCSPVFESISKNGHSPSFNWDLEGLNTDLKNKAVALGGVELNKLEELKLKGFRHIALLGAVWDSNNPMAVCQEIYEAWYKLDLIA